MSQWSIKEIPILTPWCLLESPGQSGLRWSSNIWQLLKGLKMHQRKPNNRDPTGVREIIKMPVVMAQGPKGKLVAKIMMQLEAIKIRLGGMIETRSNAITARHM